MRYIAVRSITISATASDHKFLSLAGATTSNVTMNIRRTRSGSTVTIATVTFTAGAGTTGSVGAVSNNSIIASDIIDVTMTAIDSGATFDTPYFTIAATVV
jgi:hypothetical protein